MKFRKVVILLGQGFVGWIVYMSIHLTTEAAEAAAFWGLFVFFLLFLIPTERLDPEKFTSIINALKGVKDDK